MKWSINDNDYNSLFLAVTSAFNEALINPTLTEPQLVANMVWHLPRKINAVTFTSGFSVKSGGVFVHSQPLVKCNNFLKPSPRCVEIGDLLLLRTDIRGNTIDRSAMLLQAKKYDTLPVSPDNENQHHLYASWPKFEYSRSTRLLNGQTRRVWGLDIYNAAKYLLISKNYLPCLCNTICSLNCACLDPQLYQNSLFTAQPSKPKLNHYKCFLLELLDFILGDAGKPYKTPPHWKDKNWNRVIDDLTKATATQATKFMQRASSGTSSSRGQSLFFLAGILPKKSTLFAMGKLLMEENSNNHNRPPEVPAEWGDVGGEEGGLSTIEFVTSVGG